MCFLSLAALAAAPEYMPASVMVLELSGDATVTWKAAETPLYNNNNNFSVKLIIMCLVIEVVLYYIIYVFNSFLIINLYNTLFSIIVKSTQNDHINSLLRQCQQ